MYVYRRAATGNNEEARTRDLPVREKKEEKKRKKRRDDSKVAIEPFGLTAGLHELGGLVH